MRTMRPASDIDMTPMIFAERRDKTLFVMGAATLRYGRHRRGHRCAKGAGVTRVGIVTDGMRKSRI